MSSPRKLLGFEFTSLCLIAFLAIANGTAYYDLFGHLASLGIPAGLRGLVVGAYPLVAMALYLLASPFLTARRAPRAMLAGIAILAAGGVSFLVVRSFWGLFLLRAVCGAGGFLLGAGAMALLVTVIPPGRSGEAFGIYSVAILAAYGVVPAAMDAAVPRLVGVRSAYALAGLALLPAVGLVLALRRRIHPPTAGPGGEPHLPTWADLRSSLGDARLSGVLALGVAYFANWSSLYYLFKGFATERGLGNVGAFFSVLTAVMIGIRVLGGRLFDRFDKARLASFSFGMIALGHLALSTLPIGTAPLVGAFFGLGLGAGYPALNGLVFELSEPRFRPQNANLMMFAIQLGSFLGPALGGVLVARAGYPGYFGASIVLALGSAGLAWTVRAKPAPP
jgi:MFS family permease